MRFSLGTFVLLILLISSTYAVVMLNEAWYLAQERLRQVDDGYMNWGESQISPDGRYLIKHVGVSFDSCAAVIQENNSGRNTVFQIPYAMHRAKFLSNDEVRTIDSMHVVRVYKRRFEPTALGYATRPEFLLMLTTAGLLFFRLIKKFKRNVPVDSSFGASSCSKPH